MFMIEITTEQKTIKLWLDDIEETALQQAKNIANLPMVHKWVAIMPDAHSGYGMPIGGVVALIDTISPNMVGVDIGCGMCAVNTHIMLEDAADDKLKMIMGEIRKTIPMGFNHHKHPQNENLMPKLTDQKVVQIEYSSALKQIGTLGGGNHFIEFLKNPENEVWIMLHSGSRNIGKKVCDYYNEKA